LAPVYKNRCDSYRLKGDLDRTAADFKEAIRLGPKLGSK
jgi:hypothetical protein